MKASQLIKLLAIAGLSFSAILPAHADLKEDARNVFTENEPSVLGVRGLLKIDVSMNGKPAGSQEKSLWSNGVVVADGLVALAYRTINPDLSSNTASRPGLKLESNLSELKLVDGSGEEYDAKLVLHDADLGLAFVAINPKGDKAKDFKVKAIDISKDVDVKHLDELVGLGRMSEKMRSEAQVSIGRVSAIVKRPRTLFLLQGIAMSRPVFTPKGEFVGLTVSLKNSGAVPVVIPAKYIRKVLDQAKAKQAELAE
jgi:hypothetical protein